MQGIVICISRPGRGDEFTQPTLTFKLYLCTELAKKFVLCCVIPPRTVGASSRNLGQTFFAISVHARAA